MISISNTSRGTQEMHVPFSWRVLGREMISKKRVGFSSCFLVFSLGLVIRV